MKCDGERKHVFVTAISFILLCASVGILSIGIVNLDFASVWCGTTMTILSAIAWMEGLGMRIHDDILNGIEEQNTTSETTEK
jgi:hypothetical membrane protein